MKYNLILETKVVLYVDNIIQQYIPETSYYHDKIDMDIYTTSSSLTPIWKLSVTASHSFIFCFYSFLFCLGKVRDLVKTIKLL